MSVRTTLWKQVQAQTAKTGYAVLVAPQPGGGKKVQFPVETPEEFDAAVQEMKSFGIPMTKIEVTP